MANNLENTNGQTCLENVGINQRQIQTFKNEWGKDMPYTKLLVQSEYMVQTEFPVSTFEDRLYGDATYVAEQQARNAKRQINFKINVITKNTQKNNNAVNDVDSNGQYTKPQQTLTK